MIKIAERKSRLGNITIFQARRTGSFIYSQGGFHQSEADKDGISLAPYIHALYGLLHQADSQDVLMIGCGGGTLATMLSKNGRKITVVDVNAQAFVLARKYFGLPKNLVCRVVDGCEYLLSSDRTYDAIVLDAFAGDVIPAQVRSPAFFRLARNRLTNKGSIFVNVHALDDFDDAPDRMCAAVAEIWPNVRLLDIPGHTNRNAIVMAGDVTRLTEPALLIRPQTSAEEIDSELKAMQFRTHRVPC